MAIARALVYLKKGDKWPAVPKTGSLRSWLWVCFCRDIHPAAWAGWLSKSGRLRYDDDDLTEKLTGWWTKWSVRHAKHIGTPRSGRKVRAKQASRARNYVPVGKYYSGIR